MDNLGTTFTVFVILIASGIGIYSCGVDKGKQSIVCQPGFPEISLQGHRVVCDMPDGGTEIRKY